MPDGRFVWITREMRDVLAKSDFTATASHMIAARWDAAPADPVEAVLDAMRPFVDIDAVTREELLAILAALGLPSSDETTG